MVGNQGRSPRLLHSLSPKERIFNPWKGRYFLISTKIKMLRYSRISFSPNILLPVTFAKGAFPSALFSTTRVLNENSYFVAGQTLTVSQVRAVGPLDRTVGHWMVLVDWDLQRQHPYVVVDPFDPQGLLYLSRTEYLSQLKVWASNDLSVMVIARPGSKKPDPVRTDTSPGEPSGPSQNSPPSSDRYKYQYLFEDESGKAFRYDRNTRFSWQDFVKLRSWGLRFVDMKRGMVSVSHATVARTVYMWGRELLHYAEVKNPGRRLGIFIPFVRHLQTLLRSNGSAYTVKRMKIYLFVLYTYVVGNPLESTEPLGIRVRLRNGLPAWLDPMVRGEIRRGDLAIIRVWASMLNTYRALDATHPEPDYSSILTQHPILEGKPLFESFRTFCEEVFPAEVQRRSRGKSLSFKYVSSHGLLIRSAGANLSAPSTLGVILDAQAWALQPRNHVKDWFDLHGDKGLSRLLTAMSKEEHFSPPGASPYTDVVGMMGRDLNEEELKVLVPILSKRMIAPANLASSIPYISKVPNAVQSAAGDGNPVPILGRLHAINEPAGKVRIVAICDYWTQVAMRPVHDHLFMILKLLRENDATFDQQGTVNRYFQRGYAPHWSFDLKSATDTIPIALYKEVLAPFLRAEGEEKTQAVVRTNLWAKVLTDREFGVPHGTPIRYGCGQPMGALSSWGSMALTHHALVQFAAYQVAKADYKWFKHYLILGDDVDISVNEQVADSYKHICDAFGVKIGLAKTLHSKKNGFEFANQRFIPDGNISPISLKEELSALSWSGRMELADRILTRFGTKSRDETMGLIRKVTTAPQWLALRPELTGSRSELILQFTRFCLLNPFFLALRGKKELNIDSILSWISLVQRTKENPDLSQPSVRLEFELKLYREVLNLLKLDVKRLVALNPKVPMQKADLEVNSFKPIPLDVYQRILLESDSWKSYLAMPERFRPSLPTQTPWEGKNVPIKRTAPTKAPMAYNYIMECVRKHNQDVRSRLEAFLVHPIGSMESMLPKTVTQAQSMGWNSDGKALLTVVKAWCEVKSIPVPINFDLNDPIRSLVPEDLQREGPLGPGNKVGAKLSNQEIHDRIYGPMKETCLVIGRLFGIEVPNLALFQGKRGKAWTRMIRDAVSEYLQNRIAEHASPCKGNQSSPIQSLLDWGICPLKKSSVLPIVGTAPDNRPDVDSMFSQRWEFVRPPAGSPRRRSPYEGERIVEIINGPFPRKD